MKGLRRHVEHAAGMQAPSLNHKALETRDEGLYGKGGHVRCKGRAQARLTAEERKRYTKPARRFIKCKETGDLIQVAMPRTEQKRAGVRRTRGNTVNYRIDNRKPGALVSAQVKTARIPRGKDPRAYLAERYGISGHPFLTIVLVD
jgi:hypothetical protein